MTEGIKSDLAPQRFAAVSIDNRTSMPNFAEQSALNTLQNDLFLCIMLREAGSTLSTQPFPGLQSLVNCVRHQAAEKEVSHIT